MNKFLLLYATFFGVGRFPKSPGTAGTFAAIPLVIVLSKLGPLIYMSATVVMLLVAILACEVYQKVHGREDHQEIVIDEVLGFLITMVWLPLTWQAILLGFILFRLLDITKPLFIGYLDRKIHGGLGVIMDDVAAGIIASLILQVIYSQTSWLGSQVVVLHGPSF